MKVRWGWMEQKKTFVVAQNFPEIKIEKNCDK